MKNITERILNTLQKTCGGSTVLLNFQLVPVLQRTYKVCLHVTFLYHTVSLRLRLAV